MSETCIMNAVLPVMGPFCVCYLTSLPQFPYVGKGKPFPIVSAHGAIWVMTLKSLLNMQSITLCNGYHYYELKYKYLFWKYVFDVLYLLFAFQTSLGIKGLRKWNLFSQWKSLFVHLLPRGNKPGVKANIITVATVFSFGVTWRLMGFVIATYALRTLTHTQEAQGASGWIQMLISQRFCNLFFNGPPLRHSSDTLTIMLPGLKKMLIRVLARFLHRESFCNYNSSWVTHSGSWEKQSIFAFQIPFF